MIADANEITTITNASQADSRETKHDDSPPIRSDVSETSGDTGGNESGESDGGNGKQADTEEEALVTLSEKTEGEAEEQAEQATDTQTYEVTAYTATCEGCTGITYSGYDVRHTVYSPEGLRVIATDPSVIPLGSTVRLTLSDGTTYEAVALDIGSAIVGDRIDLLVESREEALQFGRQSVEVEIISEGER